MNAILLLIVHFTCLSEVNLIHVLDFLLLMCFKSYSKSHELYLILDLFQVLSTRTYYFLPACPQRGGIALLYLAYRWQPGGRGHRSALGSWLLSPFVYWFIFHPTPPYFLQASLEIFLIFLHAMPHTPVWRKALCNGFKKLPLLVQIGF